MTNDYREAARRIISDVGRGRASEILELLDDPRVNALIKDAPSTPLDEAAALKTLQMISDMHKAFDDVSWPPEETISRERLAQALRLELGSHG